MIAVRLKHTISAFQKPTVPFLTQLAGNMNWEKGFSSQFSRVENCPWVIRAALFFLQKSQSIKLLLWRLTPHFSSRSGKRSRQGNARGEEHFSVHGMMKRVWSLCAPASFWETISLCLSVMLHCLSTAYSSLWKEITAVSKRRIKTTSVEQISWQVW